MLMSFNLSRGSFKFGAAFLLALIVPAAVSHAQITGVTDSRVQGFFASQSDGFQISDPLGLNPWAGPGAAPLPDPTSGIAGVPAAPAGGAAVAGVNGVNWVPFTFPNPRIYSGVDNAAPGAQTSTGTAIEGGFLVAGANSVTSPFVVVPQNSFLLQQPAAVGYAYTQLNFSIDYAVGAGGLAGGFGTAGYNVFGNVTNALGFAEFGAEAEYWDVTGAPVLLGTLSLQFLQNGAGAFNQNLFDVAAIAGMAGAGTLRITGDIYWHGDPATIDVQSVPEPTTFVLAALGFAGLGFVALRKKYCPA
jgi:hypothetical protein